MPISGRVRTRLLLVVVAVYALLTVPRIASYGMFLDGITYATIARNMAEGQGSFWRPYYTDTSYPVFHEQPPLGLWLQSLAFRVFGDSLLVEGLYGIAEGLLAFALIGLWWRHVRPRGAPGSWLPCLLLVAVPLIGPALTSNLLENTMLVIAMAAALVAARAAMPGSDTRAALLGLVAGSLTAAAFLVKGPAGLFAIATPLVAVVTLPGRSLRAAVLATLSCLVAVAAIAFVLWRLPEPRAFLDTYLHTQVFAALRGQRAINPSRFALATRLLTEISPAILIGLATLAWARWRPRPIEPDEGDGVRWRVAAFFALLGASASLPILLSPQQRAAYLLPSLPFYAMALGALFAPGGRRIEAAVAAERRLVPLALASIVAIAALVVTLAEWNTLRKYPEFHHDFTLAGVAVPPGEHVAVCPPAVGGDWGLVANLARQYHASVTTDPPARYLIIQVGATNCPIPPGFVAAQRVPPQAWALYAVRQAHGALSTSKGVRR